MALPRFKLHPTSVREIKMGHFWVTEDSFTEQFKKSGPLFIGMDKGNKVVGIFLNDPSHKKVKARFWKKGENYTPKQFFEDIEQRLKDAFLKRKQLSKERDNYFLVFAEADLLPGLEVLKLGNNLVIRFYADFWVTHLKLITGILNKAYPNCTLWQHQRSKGSHTKPVLIDNSKKVDSFQISEFGIKYEVFLGRSYDYGIYTDASDIRKKLTHYFKSSKSFLNLFCYTGAFSLFANKMNTKNISTSVDLSEKYLGILKKNIALNDQKIDQHEIIQTPALKALETFKKNQRLFDLILIDPPPSSSDGKKITSAIKIYPTYLSKMCSVLEPGGHMIVLLNHRQTYRSKFKQMLEFTIKERQLKLKIVEEIKLDQDCKQPGHFPEGDYLKGYVLKHD